MQIREGVQVAGMSDLGCQRENNEDRFSYWEPASDAEFARKGRLAIVADGMGGHEGGQEASRIAVEVIEEVYSQPTDSDPQLQLLIGFRQAHQQIVQYAVQHPEFRGMGTTCTAIVLLANRLYYGHIGDSRLYRVRGHEISRLTRDHSYVGRLFENGVITAEEAESHPQRHILTAALGTGPEFTPDSPDRPIPLETGDTLVLCSDGLWGPLTDHEIQQAVSENTPAEACRVLIDLTRQRGGPDNITLQVLRLR
ncbi:MAG: PP2C family serine/threonine-protein phosphatase [Terriglobales bacterium]